MSDGLVARYAELLRIEQQLRRAEQDLLAAHVNRRARTGPRPEVLYTDVLCLRAQSRELMAWLGDQLVQAP